MEERLQTRWMSIFLLSLSGFGFSIQALLVRWLTEKDIGIFQLLLLRGSCEALGCCLCLRGKPLETWLGTTPLEWKVLFVRALLAYSVLCFSFTSIALMPLADSQILQQLVPIFSAAFAWTLLQEHWHYSDFIFALPALLGVCFITRPDLWNVSLSASRQVFGIFWGLLAAVLAGGADVFVFQLIGAVKVDWASMLLAQALGQIMISPFALAVSGQQLRLFTRRQLGLSIAIGLSGFAAHVAMAKGEQKGKPVTAKLVRQSLCPIFALLWQGLFFADVLTWTSFAGFIALWLAVVTVVAKACRETQAPEATKYTEVARNEQSEGSPVRNVNCIGADDTCVLGKRSFFDEGPGRDREDEMIEVLRADGFSRRQAELALAEVQWSSAKEALDILLDVKFQLAANGKPLDETTLKTIREDETAERAQGAQGAKNSSPS